MIKNNYILGTRVDSLTYKTVVDKIFNLENKNRGRYISIANVHVVMESYDNIEYRNIINKSLIVTPDGVPLVWGLKFMGNTDIERVYGPHLTLYLCEIAENKNLSVGFYGSSKNVINKLRNNLIQKYPSIKIEYTFSPPFRSLNESEDDQIISEINKSGIKILFVGLGCPKQERWMYEHKDKINPLMIGVGAAFDFIAGEKPQAPKWMQTIGMEWIFRLITEPKRLWKRYLYHNPRFIFYFTLQLLGLKKFNNID